ncbi:MAG: Thioredoxin, partial [uncultured Thermomicrobiales bacterium]
RQGQHRRPPAVCGPIRHHQHPDHDAVQGWREGRADHRCHAEARVDRPPRDTPGAARLFL